MEAQEFISEIRGMIEKGRAREAINKLRQDDASNGPSLPKLEWEYVAQSKLEDASAAKKVLAEMLRQFPSSGRPDYLLAREHVKSGDHKKAIEHLIRADLKAPNDFSTLEELTHCYRVLGEKTLELSSARRMIEAAPFKLGGYFWASRAALDLGYLVEAEKLFVRGKSIIDEPGSFAFLELEVHLLSAKQRRTAGFEKAQELQQKYPATPSAHFLVGRRAMDLAKYHVSEKHFKVAIELAANEPKHYRYCIEAQRLNANYEGAMQTAEQFAGIAPSEAAILASEILIELNRGEEGLARLVKASEHFADHKLLLHIFDLSLALGCHEFWLKVEDKARTVLNEKEWALLERRWLFASKGEVPSNASGSTTSREQIKFLTRKYNVYTMPHQIVGFDFVNIDDFRVYVMEGLSHSVRLYTDFSVPDNSYFFVQYPIFMEPKNLEAQVRFFEEITEGRFSRDRIVIMVNDPGDLKICHEFGLTRSFVCNNNCWLDYDLFTVRDGVEKRFDMVMNCRPERTMKRPYLARNVDSLAVIQGALVRSTDFWDLEQLEPAYMNREGRIPPSAVVDVLNQSYSGGIFSPREGACYASSEYLLCGLPVISTKSDGGRDLWYNSDNSIIVEPDADDVHRATKEAKQRIVSGDWSAQAIRDAHVKLSDKQRGDFISLVDQIVSENGYNCDVEALFKMKFSNQFKIVAPYSES